MKKVLLLLPIVIFALTSCTRQKATIFQIGQSRESVIKTIANDFKVDNAQFFSQIFLHFRKVL